MIKQHKIFPFTKTMVFCFLYSLLNNGYGLGKDTSKYAMYSGCFYYSLEEYKLDSNLQRRNQGTKCIQYCFTNYGAEENIVIKERDTLRLDKTFRTLDTTFSFDSLVELLIVNEQNPSYGGFIGYKSDFVKYKGKKCERYLYTSIQSDHITIYTAYYYKRVPVKAYFEIGENTYLLEWSNFKSGCWN